MTLAEVERLFRYWNDNPPIRDLVHAVAIWAGAVKPPARKRSSTADSAPSLAELKGLLGEH